MAPIICGSMQIEVLNYQRQFKDEQALSSYEKVLKADFLNMTERNKRVRYWVYRNSKFYSLFAEKNGYKKADQLYEVNEQEFPYDLCVPMRQSKFRLNVMDNPRGAILSALRARKAGCNADRHFLVIAYYQLWAHLKANGGKPKEIELAFRKATALAPEDVDLISELIKYDKTAHLIEHIENLNLDAQNASGYTALSREVASYSYKNVELLLKAGADPNPEVDETNLMTKSVSVSSNIQR